MSPVAFHGSATPNGGTAFPFPPAIQTQMANEKRVPLATTTSEPLLSPGSNS
jgi:hypothetical protein